VRDHTIAGEAKPFKCSPHCTVGHGTVRALQPFVNTYRPSLDICRCCFKITTH
jgi:hypothetical protein